MRRLCEGKDDEEAGGICASIELTVSPDTLQVSFEVLRVKMTSDDWNVTYQHVQLE